MLTVACYMIQHNRYTDEALVWIPSTLSAHLDDSLSVQEIRRGMGQTAANDILTWKVIRPPDARALPSVTLSVTIADAAHSYRDTRSGTALGTRHTERNGRCAAPRALVVASCQSSVFSVY